MANPPTLDDVRDEYLELFVDCEVKSDKLADVKAVMDTVVAHRRRYEIATGNFTMPWWFVGLLHAMEGDSNFGTHLHNGDPLTARTVHVPVGRPVANPRAHPDKAPGTDNAYTWEESAEDAIRAEGLDTWTDWSLAGTLFKLEAFNGFGYRMSHPDVLSPYLWSFTNHYVKGKFVRDGVFDADFVSTQAGAAAVLYMMAKAGTVTFPDLTVFIAKRMARQAVGWLARTF